MQAPPFFLLKTIALIAIAATFGVILFASLKPQPHSVAWFNDHPKERATVIVQCNAAPDALSDANCQNAAASANYAQFTAPASL